MYSPDPAALDCLAALADGGTFERAAQRLAITQSAVSQRLRALESQCGLPLVVRSRPLRLTEPGKLMLGYARQMQALQADLARELCAVARVHQRLPIAVNADSLATWLLPALDTLMQDGLTQGYGLELIVDDQDFAHEWLLQGAVLGCVSALGQALRGCLVQPLGTMPYTAVASPAFVARCLPNGLDRRNFSQVPFLAFNRKDAMHTRWVSRALGLSEPRLIERHVPSSEAYARATLMGWGIGVLPELQIREPLARGELVALEADVRLDVALYWHQWKRGTDPAPRAGSSLLDRVGAALAVGARRAFTG